jgi:hypothetical protein
VAWTDPPTSPPDQNPGQLVIKLRRPREPGRQGLLATGLFNPATDDPPLDPSASGLHLHLEDDRGVLYQVDLPGGPVGSSACDPADGWALATLDGAPVWEYTNLSGAVDPPDCTPGSAQGIERISIRDLRATPTAAYRFEVSALDATLRRIPRTKPRSLYFALGLGTQLAPGMTSAESREGQCVDAFLWNGGAPLDCERGRKSRSLTCTGRQAR